MEQTIHRILIVRNDRIGDVILTLPIAQVLRNYFPSAHIAMLIQRYTAEVVEDSRFVDHIVFYDDGQRSVPMFHLVSTLRRERFDIVFHMRPRFRLALMTWIARIPVRVGTGYRWYSFLFNNKVYEHRKDAQFHELEYNLHLLRAIGIDVPEGSVKPSLSVRQESVDVVKRLLTESGFSESETLVILHPGSGRSARDWSAEKFGELGKKLSQLPGVKILVIGGRGEEALVSRIQTMIGSGSQAWVDRLTLREYAALAKQAKLFVANSTGPIHIAAAVVTPVIGLYPQVTALSAKRWAPYTERKTIFSPVGKPIDCHRCLSQNSSVCECMESISVDEVYAAARRFLHENDFIKANDD